MKSKKIGMIAGILTIIIVVVSINTSVKEIYAKETLPGVETIINNNGTNNPYIILEVVPNKSNAALGYLAGGEEPLQNGKSLNDIPVSSLRLQYMNAFTAAASSCPTIFGADSNTYPLNVDATGYAEPGDSSKSFDLKGSFVEDVAGDYVSSFQEAKYSWVTDNTVAGITYYEKYYEFYNMANTNDRYQISLNQVSLDRTFETTSSSSEFTTGTNYNTLNKYFLNEQWSGDGITTLTDNILLDANTGHTVFQEDFTGEYKYFGIIQTQAVTYADLSVHNISFINGFDGKYYVFDDSLNNKIVTTADNTAITLVDVTDSDIDSLRFLDIDENDVAGDYAVTSVTPITALNAYGFVADKVYRENSAGFYIKDTNDLTEYIPYDSSFGTSKTRYNWLSNYAISSSSTVFYQGGFSNHEWLKQYVFDLDLANCSNFILDVKTITMDELNNYDLSKVGIVYFAGGTYPTDITQSKAIEIKQLMENNNLPVIWNRSTYLSAIGVNPNLEKLGIVLQQTTLSTASATNISAKWLDSNYWTTLTSTMRAPSTTYGLNYVNQSLYVYDNTDFNATDGIGSIPFVNTDFITNMAAAKITYGFQAVADEISSENFFLSVAGKSERISTNISKASAIRYIINYGNKRNIIKTKISVLEIEPCNSKKIGNDDSNLETYYTDTELKTVRTSTTTTETVNILDGHALLTKEMIATKWAKQFNATDKIDNISLTRTHTGEFVGKIEDLNETYDLIYLGLDTSTMNTSLTGTAPNRKKTINTIFNDTAMNGLVYYHVGDVIKSDSDYFLGLLNPTDFTKESSYTEYQKYRMSGNDITLDKYNDLVEYLNAGYPVIFADGFYNNNNGVYTVNTAKIDKSSYMYKIAQYALEHRTAGNIMLGENVFTESMLAADTTGNGALSKLAQYLNLSKLSITSTYLPEAYSMSGTTAQYLSKTNGEYVLRYDIALKNDSAISLSDTKYDCKLYIDKSVDGRYASDEEIGNLSIYELKNGVYVQVYQNAAGKYELTAGKFYKIIRLVPEGYVGVLPWKLQFTQNDNTLVRKSISGYTAVPIPTTTKKTIHVLNITNKTSTSTNFDLNSTAMKNLLTQVKDFDIVIDVMSAQDYMNKVTNTSLQSKFTIDGYSSFLDQYQMLIIGFWDSYSIESGTNLQNEAGVWAIRQYISEGRSVLFTHDTVNYNYYLQTKPYWFNLFIRDSVGMDRYGVMSQSNVNNFSIIPTANKTAKTINYTYLPTKYDTAWLPGVSMTDQQLATAVAQNASSKYTYTYRNVQAFSDFLLLRNGYWLKNLGSKYTFTSIPFDSYSNYDGNNITVSRINDGQITEYPFTIPESFDVSMTHGQWLQLNLDTDSNDSYTNDDIVVWYTISNVKNGSTDIPDYYQASLNNARNNYYIYNRGNVTYSGVGHSAVNNETEMKLFINTMVAAYNAGISPPTVLYKESAKDSAGTIEKTYLPYDTGDGTISYLDNDAEIYFDVIDTNIKYGTKSIHADYYVQVTSSESYDVVKNINGTNVYLKAITPSVSKVTTNSVISDCHVLEDGSRYKFTLTQQQLSLLSKNSSYVWIFTDVTYKRIGENNVEIVESSVPGFSKMEIVNLQLFDLK